MISPDFRATEVTNIFEGFKYYITQNHGDGLFKDLEPDIQRCANVRKEIVDAIYHRTDAEQLKKFKDLFLENYKIQTLLQKYFTYGNQKNQVNVTYTWYDSFTKQKKQAMSPTLDAISSLFNYAVACSRIACYQDLTGDGIKEASKMFQQAGWVFEHLRTLVIQVAPSEITCDFTAESLGTLSNLMLAQAQYLFYKKASDAGFKAAVLAKTAMQVSEYFKKAFELSQTNTGLKSFDQGKFANILFYHSYYFEAMAYYVIANEEYKKAGEQGKGMGNAVSYFKVTASIFEKAKQIVLLIPSNYQENFNNKLAEVIKLRDKAIAENKTIYFERETPESQIPKPDMQNFVKLEPVLGDLSGKLNLEDKLRHIVPPPVRGMQEELKNLLQELIQKNYDLESKVDADQKAFLASNGLPQALHAVTSTTDIPAQLWQKIEEFQKKGGSSNIQGMIQGVEGLKQNNQNLINQMRQTLDDEENSDSTLRQQHGTKWNRLPSNALNVQFRQSLQDYLNKLNQASSTDSQIEQKLQQNVESFQLLSKTKQELGSMIPQTTGSQELSQSPVIQTIRGTLDDLDKLEEERRQINDEAVQRIQNFNAIEDLLGVNQGAKQKTDVFEKHKNEFKQILSKLEVVNKRRAELNSQISSNIGAFAQLLASVHNDPSKSQFFQKLDQAINGFNELSTMLHQGSQFYTRLGDILNKLYQNIMDFKMSREMEKNDLINRMGGFQQPPPQQQLPPGQLPAYGQQPGYFPPQQQQFYMPPSQYQPPQQQPGSSQNQGFQFYDPNKR